MADRQVKLIVVADVDQAKEAIREITQVETELEKAERKAKEEAKAQAKEQEKQAKEAKKAAEAEQKLKDAKEKELATAKKQLEAMGDAGDASAQLRRKFQETAEEIEKLKQVTGDEAGAARALAAAQRQLEDDLAAANDSAKEQADKFGDAGSRISGFAGALDTVFPGLGGLIQPMADLAGGAEAAALSASAAGVSMATLAASAALVLAPLGALAGAYVLVTQNIEQQNAQRELEHQLAEEARDIYYQLEDSQQALALATGKLTEAQDAELTIRRQIQRTVKDALTAHEDEKKALREQIEDTQKYINVQRGLAATLTTIVDLALWPETLKRATAEGKSFQEVMREDARATNDMLDSVTGLESGVKAAKGQIETYNQAGQDQANVLSEIKDNTIAADKATRSKANADEQAAEAAARSAAAQQESAAAMAESSAVAQQYQATFAQIKKVTDDYNSSVLTGSAAIEDARKREQAALLAIYQQTMANAQSDQERMDANAAFADARASIDAKYATQQMTLADEQAAKFEENHALALQYAQEESASAGSALTEKAAAAKSFFDENIAVYADAVGQIADIASEFSQKALEESLARLDKLSERRKRLTEQQKENAKAAQEATDAQTRSELEAANAILEDKKARLKEQSKEERQQAMKAFRINQAIQIAGAISSSALAVINAFATVPYPAAIAAGVAASAAGTAAVATVLAQKPQFHQGGVVQANVLSGEGVANRDLVRAVGEPTFNAMNRNPEAAAAALTGGGGTSLIIGRREAAELARTMIVGRTIVSREIGKRQLPNRVAPGTSNKSVLS